jgi:peroxiredoxin
VRIFGISRDSPYSHRSWSKQQWLSYPLLSDWHGDAVRAFGVAQTIDGLADSPVRSAFLIDASATIRRAWRSGDDEVPSIDEQLQAAQALAGSA